MLIIGESFKWLRKRQGERGQGSQWSLVVTVAQPNDCQLIAPPTPLLERGEGRQAWERDSKCENNDKPFQPLKLTSYNDGIVGSMRCRDSPPTLCFSVPTLFPPLIFFSLSRNWFLFPPYVTQWRRKTLQKISFSITAVFFGQTPLTQKITPDFSWKSFIHMLQLRWILFTLCLFFLKSYFE